MFLLVKLYSWPPAPSLRSSLAWTWWSHLAIPVGPGTHLPCCHMPCHHLDAPWVVVIVVPPRSAGACLFGPWMHQWATEQSTNQHQPTSTINHQAPYWPIIAHHFSQQAANQPFLATDWTILWVRSRWKCVKGGYINMYLCTCIYLKIFVIL